MSITDHIAIAIDFSEPSEVAFRAALTLADMTKASKVTVIHACREVVMPQGKQDTLRGRLLNLQHRIVEAAVKQIDELAQKMGATNVAHHIVAGRPTEVVPRAVEEVGATVLVLGTRARKGLRRLFMGSVAETLLRGLKVPALVMHVGGDGIPPDEELAKIDNAVVGLDLDQGSRSVLHQSVEFLAALNRPTMELKILHALDEHASTMVLGHTEGTTSETAAAAVDAYRTTHAEWAGQRLAELTEEFSTDEVKVIGEVVDGDADDVILDDAKANTAEMIIVGSHGRGLALFGSTAEHVIRRSEVIVMVVPPGPM